MDLEFSKNSIAKRKLKRDRASSFRIMLHSRYSRPQQIEKWRRRQQSRSYSPGSSERNPLAHSFLFFRVRHNLLVVIAILLIEKWNPVRAGHERFRKSPQRGQRSVIWIGLATMSAIASTEPCFLPGTKAPSGKSALARRTESSTRLANIAVQRQVSGTSDCAKARSTAFYRTF